MYSNSAAPDTSVSDLTPLSRSVKITLSVIVIIGAAVIMWACGLRFNLSTVEGEKVGQIYGVHKQGIFFKSWEAELIRGGLNNSSGSFGGPIFHFTIGDDHVKEVSQYATSGTEVVVRYKQPHFYWTQSTETDGIFLTDIRPAK
jgi:hypothetical protein